jgi:hypothetical protein
MSAAQTVVTTSAANTADAIVPNAIRFNMVSSLTLDVPNHQRSRRSNANRQRKAFRSDDRQSQASWEQSPNSAARTQLPTSALGGTCNRDCSIEAVFLTASVAKAVVIRQRSSRANFRQRGEKSTFLHFPQTKIKIRKHINSNYLHIAMRHPPNQTTPHLELVDSRKHG